MASDSPAENARYACKCLNVQITSSTQSPASFPEGTRDSAYEPIFVNDDGIAITHPQVTVRTTTNAKPIPGTSRCSRFIVLTCLLCRLPVYRVFQTIPLEIQGKESILLPTDNWVEREILKSATGWVEVHEDCIVGDSILQAKASSSYSPSFSLLLPSSTPSPSLETNAETSSSDSTQLPTQTYLPVLRSLFFPPPFSPSHPIFMHLASIANQESQNLRATAEQRIADFVKAETVVIEGREQRLKHQVEVLWTMYRDHLNTLQEGPNPNVPLSPVSHNGSFGPGLMNNSPSVSVRNFNPVPISAPLSPSSSVPRTSALSASMATSTFHHRNVSEARSKLSVQSSGSYGSGSSHTLSTQSKSPLGTHTNVLRFTRNVNDAINTQASYKYFVNLEEDVARYKRSQEMALKEQQEAEASKGTQQASSGAKVDGNSKHKIVEETPTLTEDEIAKHQETTSPRGRDKGKRKVTFDVKPAVMTTEDDGKVEEDVTAEQDSGEMVFALEDLEDKEYTGDPSDIKHSTLPLLEQPVFRPLRPRKIRSQTNIETFSSLRPSSLPAPSHIRPMRSQPHVDSSSHVMLPHPKVLTTPTPGDSLSPPVQRGSYLQVTSEHDAELLRLVAANTPSHRGAWTPNSRAWQTFTQRQDSKEVIGRSRIPEEGEETEETDSEVEGPPAVIVARDDYNDNVSLPVSCSVPINIVVHSQPPKPLSISSYRPNTTLPNEAQPSTNGDVPHGQKIPSSTSFRKAKYAERDRSRAMDPGALDFAAGAEDDIEEEVEMDQMKFESGERAREQALRILKARNELPEAGMWRSLA